jgi:hypothetical protein
MPYKYFLNNTITNGIYSRNRTKFELINLKVFKKIFSFKKKKKNLYKKKKY